MPLTIKDRPGVIPAAEMRRLFEMSITDTPQLRANTPLGAMEVNGEFSHYMNPETDTMWIGFALGMRCAERREKARASADVPATAPTGS